ncbi:MAG: hypothetical protein B0D92_05825 [Spirochaeta sp. LUC14_002_19_P3]|nr:MAG: hypothetical protein B0D92_05825 [Spirochaeta sp. LUC14_002_19_P3]
MTVKEELSDKLSGRALYRVYNLKGKNYQGRILGSPTARGRIVGIKLPPLPEGICVIGAKDIPGADTLDIGGCAIPIFASGNILWEGQPILAAAGGDSFAVEEWLSKVELEIEQSADAQPEESEFVRRKGSPEKHLNTAAQIVEESLLIPYRREPEHWDGATCKLKDESYHLYTVTVWPLFVRACAARVLNVSPNRVKVSGSSPGGRHEGYIWHSAYMAVIAALLSKKADEPVYLNAGSLHSVGPSLPGADIKLRAAIREDGKLSALEGKLVINAGALLPFADEIIDRVLLGLFSFSTCLHYNIKVIVRRHPWYPSTFGPAAGLELGFPAGELLAARIAETLKVPVEQWKQDSSDADNSLMGSGIVRPRDYPSPALFDDLLTRSDYMRKSTGYNHVFFNRGKFKRLPEFYHGIGTAKAWFGNSFISSELENAGLSLTLDKQGILLVSMQSEASGVLIDIWKGMATDILGIDKVLFQVGGGRESCSGAPVILGSHAAVYTRLLDMALKQLAKQRFREALPITIEKNLRHGSRPEWSRENLAGAPFEAYSWGMGVVEVRLSVQASVVESVRIWLQIDGGQLLSYDKAAAEAENAAAAALEWCSSKPRRFLLPLIDVQFSNNSEKFRPKGVSALPWLLVPAAYIKALRQASGRFIDQLPVQPEQMRMGSPCL